MKDGRIVQLSVSAGGVPKLQISEAEITASAEVLAALAREGHAASPGAVGENVTVEGLPWERVVPGARLGLGEQVVLEITRYASPCKTIAHVFRDGISDRISQKSHPGESRVYARVLAPGRVQTGDAVRLLEVAD
jgi:MOSC domain-containing protein YiiM